MFVNCASAEAIILEINESCPSTTSVDITRISFARAFQVGYNAKAMDEVLVVGESALVDSKSSQDQI
jgi:hypothetical protein